MSNYLNVDVDRFAATFKALSNPQRLRLFLRLADCCRSESGPCCGPEETSRCVGEVGRDLGLAASTISHHLKELARADLIRMQRKGRTIQCWVEPDTLRNLAEFFEDEPSE
jgi:ArsR family transcriptional regulator